MYDDLEYPSVQAYYAAKRRLRRLVATTLLCIGVCALAGWCWYSGSQTPVDWDPGVLVACIIYAKPAGIAVRLLIGVLRFAFGGSF